jgi:uncharacterized membrane protein
VREDTGVHHQPQGAAFDIVLLCHVACVVVTLATVVTSAAMASRLRRALAAAASPPEAVLRYFHPGVNWAGRSVYGIPVFGFALVAMSQGAYALHQGWVMAGLTIFVVVAFLAEALLWPAERRIAHALAPVRDGDAPVPPDITGDARVMALSAAAALVLLVAGSALMVAQP